MTKHSQHKGLKGHPKGNPGASHDRAMMMKGKKMPHMQAGGTIRRRGGREQPRPGVPGPGQGTHPIGLGSTDFPVTYGTLAPSEREGGGRRLPEDYPLRGQPKGKRLPPRFPGDEMLRYGRPAPPSTARITRNVPPGTRVRVTAAQAAASQKVAAAQASAEGQRRRELSARRMAARRTAREGSRQKAVGPPLVGDIPPWPPNSGKPWGGGEPPGYRYLAKGGAVKPKVSKAGQGRVSAKISQMHKMEPEMPHKQMVAMSLNMERKGRLGKKGGYKKAKK